MGEEQPRGRRGGYARRQPRPGADTDEEEPRPNRRDQQDLEIAAQGRQIRELERVLSAPYLQSNPIDQYQDLDSYNMRSKGLCLVPTSYTMGVASSNGADIWAPIKTHSPT
ncbi:hypothetical protein Tco_1207219 [Tanacetum coccineum]